MTLAFGLTAALVGLLMLRHSDRAGWRVLFYGGTAWAVLAKGFMAGGVPPAAMVFVTCVLDCSFATVRRRRMLHGVPAATRVRAQLGRLPPRSRTPHHHGGAGVAGRLCPLRQVFDTFDIGDRGAAALLHDDCHCHSLTAGHARAAAASRIRRRVSSSPSR